MKKIVKSADAPAAIGPYSQAVVAGDYIYVSGQLPIDPATGALVENDISVQTRQSLKNIGAILAEAGARFIHVIKTTVMLKNISDFAAMNTVYAEFFVADCPARAAYAVADLPKGALVEIEVVAYKPIK